MMEQAVVICERVLIVWTARRALPVGPASPDAPVAPAGPGRRLNGLGGFGAADLLTTGRIEALKRVVRRRGRGPGVLRVLLFGPVSRLQRSILVPGVVARRRVAGREVTVARTGALVEQ